MKITINVTQDDIRDGEPQANNICPIALALRRLMPDVIPAVYEYSAVVGAVPHRQEIPLPPAAIDFIGDFDAGNTVAPFAFDLDVPDELAPAGEPS